MSILFSIINLRICRNRDQDRSQEFNRTELVRGPSKTFGLGQQSHRKPCASKHSRIESVVKEFRARLLGILGTELQSTTHFLSLSCNFECLHEVKTSYDVPIGCYMQGHQKSNYAVDQRFQANRDWRPLSGGIFAYAEFREVEQLQQPWEYSVVHGKVPKSNQHKAHVSILIVLASSYFFHRYRARNVPI